jgi:hypothetical protein
MRAFRSGVCQKSFLALAAILALAGTIVLGAQGQTADLQNGSSKIDYRVLATNRTSTMEKELNEAAEAGFRFQAVMGGDRDDGRQDCPGRERVGRNRTPAKSAVAAGATPRSCHFLARRPLPE